MARRTPTAYGAVRVVGDFAFRDYKMYSLLSSGRLDGGGGEDSEQNGPENCRVDRTLTNALDGLIFQSLLGERPLRSYPTARHNERSRFKIVQYSAERA